MKKKKKKKGKRNRGKNTEATEIILAARFSPESCPRPTPEDEAQAFCRWTLTPIGKSGKLKSSSFWDLIKKKIEHKFAPHLSTQVK